MPVTCSPSACRQGCRRPVPSRRWEQPFQPHWVRGCATWRRSTGWARSRGAWADVPPELAALGRLLVRAGVRFDGGPGVAVAGRGQPVGRPGPDRGRRPPGRDLGAGAARRLLPGVLVPRCRAAGARHRGRRLRLTVRPQPPPALHRSGKRGLPRNGGRVDGRPGRGPVFGEAAVPHTPDPDPQDDATVRPVDPQPRGAVDAPLGGRPRDGRSGA